MSQSFGDSASSKTLIALGLALSIASGCSEHHRPSPRAPVIPVTPADPNIDALNRCNAALAQAQLATTSAAPASPSLASDRLVLSQKWMAARKDEKALDARIAKARRAVQALAATDKELAIVSDAALTLIEGGTVKPALPSRILKNESWRDLTEAAELRNAKRAEVERIATQMDNVDKLIGGAAAAPAP
jgi:hypothetical protein